MKEWENDDEMASGYMDKILERASVKGVADHILFGIGQKRDTRSYEERMEKASRMFDEVAESDGDKERAGDLIDAASAFSCSTALVYAELGMQAAMLLLKDMFRHIDIRSEHTKASLERGVYDFMLEQVRLAIHMLEQPKEENRERTVKMLKTSIEIAEEMLEGE